MAFLQLENIQKTYPDGTQAVKGINLECEEGDFIVLLGPSGCGKTTTLRMIAGLEIPTGGSIEVAGQDITRQPPTQRDIGFVFQFYALYPHMKVRQNIAFPLENMGIPEPQRIQQVGQIIGQLGLEDLADLYPPQLSGGDQQRVALARAMVRRPQLYLMDEPLGTLDADLRIEMRELIRSQQLAMGITTLYVTHDQEEAMSLADQVVVMEGGQIRQAAPPGQIYRHPADLFVAHFIGSPGMNFIDGHIESGHFSVGQLRLKMSQAAPNGTVRLGIRPEHIRLDEAGHLAAKVVLNEFMGSMRNIHLDSELGRIIVRSEEANTPAIGQHVKLWLESENACLFDVQSGRGL